MVGITAVVGWVINLNDGRVEMALEGDRVDEMLDWVKKGLPVVEVDKMEVNEVKISDSL